MDLLPVKRSSPARREEEALAGRWRAQFPLNLWPTAACLRTFHSCFGVSSLTSIFAAGSHAAPYSNRPLAEASCETHPAVHGWMLLPDPSECRCQRAPPATAGGWLRWSLARIRQAAFTDQFRVRSRAKPVQGGRKLAGGGHQARRADRSGNRRPQQLQLLPRSAHRSRPQSRRDRARDGRGAGRPFRRSTRGRSPSVRRQGSRSAGGNRDGRRGRAEGSRVTNHGSRTTAARAMSVVKATSSTSRSGHRR